MAGSGRTGADERLAVELVAGKSVKDAATAAQVAERTAFRREHFMTIRFRNPWVDPRVLDVRPADVEAYLRDRGWSETDSATSHVKRFISPQRGTDREAVLVPEMLDDGPLLNLLIECLGKVAAWEARYAGDLLNELLGTSAVPPTPRCQPLDRAGRL